MAQEVLESPSPAEAKAVASRVPSHLHQTILHAKAGYCDKFKEELLNSGGKRLVESVRGDIFWSAGLPPRIAESTKHDYFPGENQLGHVVESVRFDLMKETLLCNDVHERHAIPVQSSTSNRFNNDLSSGGTTHSLTINISEEQYAYRMEHGSSFLSIILIAHRRKRTRKLNWTFLPVNHLSCRVSLLKARFRYYSPFVTGHIYSLQT